jgi:pilus assembly protein CpaC
VLTVPVVGKVKRIALGNGSYVSATTVDSSLLLIAEQVGATRLMVWTDKRIYNYQIKVIHPDLAGTKRLLDLVVRSNNGLRIEDLDSRIVVSGVAHEGVIAQLNKIANNSPAIFLNVDKDDGPAPVPSVVFRLHFVEVNKSLIESIGIRWNRELAGPTIGAQASRATGVFNTPAARDRGFFVSLATELASRINLGTTDGDVRLLASPELTAKSGGKARLQVGGEVPIPIAGALGTVTIEFKPYGIIFGIEPRVDINGGITAMLSTELSQIDPAVRVNGVPGFLTRATSTEISVNSGEVFALSGLLSGELSNAIDKVPGLGNIPILGRLFSSDDYRNQRTDLVVLVQPEIVEPGRGISEEMKMRGLRNIQDYRNISAARETSGGRKPLEMEPQTKQPSPSQVIEGP